jgi:hypothetical protein
MPDVDLTDRRSSISFVFGKGEAAFARVESGPALLLNVPWQVPPNTLFSHCLRRQLYP